MPPASKPDPGTPLGDKAPKLETFQNTLCPNCETGVVYVIRYDPDAEHETAQGSALEKGRESGGAVERKCFYCDYGDTLALNPGERWGKAADNG